MLMPESSMVGMLMGHVGHFRIIESEKSGMIQHSPYYWQVGRNDFRYTNDTRTDSKIFDHAIRDWAAMLSWDERQVFFDTVYEIILASEANSIKDFGFDKLKKLSAMVRAAKNLSPETRKLLLHVIGELVAASAHSVIEVMRGEE